MKSRRTDQFITCEIFEAAELDGLSHKLRLHAHGQRLIPYQRGHYLQVSIAHGGNIALSLSDTNVNNSHEDLKSEVSTTIQPQLLFLLMGNSATPNHGVSASH